MDDNAPRLTELMRITLKNKAGGLEDVKQIRVKAGQRMHAIPSDEQARLNPSKYEERFFRLLDSEQGNLMLESVEASSARDVTEFIRMAFPEIYLWATNTSESKGIGIDSISRLIGELGDPRWATFHDTIPNVDYDPDKPTVGDDNAKTTQVARAAVPRTLRQWYAYGGIGDPDRKRNAKGVTAEEVLAAGRPMGRVILFIIATNIVKSGIGGAYRDLYDRIKDEVADKLHDRPCQQCAGKGKAPESAIGTPWKDGHKHAHAMRLVSKEVMRDLWLITGGEAARYGTGRPVLEFSQEPLPEKVRRQTKFEKQAAAEREPA